MWTDLYGFCYFNVCFHHLASGRLQLFVWRCLVCNIQCISSTGGVPPLLGYAPWSRCKVSIARTRVPNTNAHQAGASGMGPVVSMDVYCCCSVTQCHILGYFWEDMLWCKNAKQCVLSERARERERVPSQSKCQFPDFPDMICSYWQIEPLEIRSVVPLRSAFNSKEMRWDERSKSTKFLENSSTMFNKRTDEESNQPKPEHRNLPKKHTKGFDQQNEGNMGISMCTFPGPTSLIPTPSAIILIPR